MNTMQMAEAQAARFIRVEARVTGCGSATVGEPRLVRHDCRVEGTLSIEAGKACNWCGEVAHATPFA